MSQLSFLFGGRDKDFVMAMVTRQTPWHFRAEFPKWLSENWGIWQRFEREANKVYAMGRPHYSARTLIEFLRHETALREADSEYKITNNVVPDMARLYVTLYPERSGFFDIRTSELRVA